MCATHVVVDGLSNVVIERGLHGDLRIDADKVGNEARGKTHFIRVARDVLSVARSEVQSSHIVHKFGRCFGGVESHELEGFGSFFVAECHDFFFRFVHRLFDHFVIEAAFFLHPSLHFFNRFFGDVAAQ